MVNFTVEQLREIMNHKNNIRNISVIAHVDHGKSTLTDSLIQKGGMISEASAGEMKFTETREDEKLRGITIKSTGVSLYYELPEDQRPKDSTAEGFLINLIDSPGHVDFSSEVTAALRVTDGALVVVDCVEGVCVQTETVMKQALAERIKPVLMVNKMDRAFMELQLDGEEAYQSFLRTIESVNVVLATYEDPALGEIRMDPTIGNIAFGSGLQGWAFTINQFAKIYSKKLGISTEKLAARLWGDNFYDPTTKRWQRHPLDKNGNTLPRGFVQYIYNPISSLISTITKDEREKFPRIFESLGIHLNSDELALSGKLLLKCVMRKWLPAADALIELIVHHLPSPVKAQKYRVETLYEGPMDDECAMAIRDCDPDGPLMVYISKMVPTSEKTRFFAFGRVFSGTVKTGQKVRIMGPNYVPGSSEDLYIKSIQRTVIMMGRGIEVIDDCPCGNTIALMGVDKFLTKSGTISTSEVAHNIKVMKFSVSPVVRVAVEPKNPIHLPKLIEGLRRLAKSDPCVQCYTDDTGKNIIAGVGELHVEICINDLKEFCGVELITSEPIVNFRETVTQKSEFVCLAKSPNKLNRLFLSAEPIDEMLSIAIEKGVISSNDDPKARAKLLVNDYLWDRSDANKIWCFGPDNDGPNVLVDQSKGVAYLQEIKDSCAAAFNWATSEGALTGEPMRGIKFNIHDAMLHSSSNHRSSAQIIPTIRRALYSSQLTAQPRLLEPVYLVEISTHQKSIGAVYNVICGRRGQIVSEESRGTSQAYTIKAYLPVTQSFGFSADLRSQTGGQAFPQCTFDHWQVINQDPLDPSSPIATVVNDIRLRNGLPPTIPPLDHYLDVL